jgi:polysaccharide deacetylase family protein (PEP-CTERM system associated)
MEHHLGEPLDRLLTLLDKYQTRATFFVLGDVAQNHPDLLERVHERGHNIACHGYSHIVLSKLTRDDFDVEIKNSVKLFKHITHAAPRGFRAPCFSLKNDTRWALDVLARNGFEYDSSIYPITKRLYGVPDAPASCYRPSKDDITQHDRGGKIVEFPLTTLNVCGTNVPISGGFYLRLLPLSVLKHAIRQVNRSRPAIIYVHPWELDEAAPRLRAPLISRFEAYYGTKTALKKVEALLREFHFAPAEDVLQEI